MKYPGLDMKEKNYRATCALELRYEKFNEEDIVVKTNKLGNEEVSIAWVWYVLMLTSRLVHC